MPLKKESNQDVLLVLRSNYPVLIRVFLVATSDGDVMHLFIFLPFFNADAYIKLLEKVLMTWF